MAISSEIRRLTAKWKTGTGWPKRLDWIEIRGLRGWTGQRFKMDYPIMAVVGENGVGKSTVLQCAAAVYQPSPGRFASDFFPDTTWDQVRDATISYAVREGTAAHQGSVRKPGERWRGNPDRRERHVKYIDLSRIQPVPARVGYARLANAQHTEVSAASFEQSRLVRFSQIMGRQYEFAKMALTSADPTRSVPVLKQHGAQYSGFHQGAGETTVAELLQADLQQYSIVLIDEIETSLHPRSQRRLIRDLAEKCRELELQVVLTTHSPFVLDELPPEARSYILETGATRNIVYGVSPEFAMTKMDDVPQPECDLYVEDNRAERLLIEIIVKHGPSLVSRCRTIRYGASSVGQSLGLMVSQRRFPRPSCVFLDADQGPATGCVSLPGEDAPERVVLESLRMRGWSRTAERLGRTTSDLDDAFGRAMSLTDHHEWLRNAAIHLTVGSDTLWQVLCSEWAATALDETQSRNVLQPIEDALEGIPTHPSVGATSLFDSSGRGLLFEL